MFKRLVYLIYYQKELDRTKFNLFANHVERETARSKVSLWLSAVQSVFKYNISLMEYFQFRFYQIPEEEKLQWAGTGFMYEYQKLMNPPGNRKVLADKPEFLKTYKDFVYHSFLRKDEVLNSDQVRTFINSNNRLVLKSSDGQCGRGIEIISTSGLTPEKLFQELERTENDMVEAFVEQHPELNRLSPTGLNTVRIITQLNKEGRVDYLGARLRITINSSVDNLAAGNMAATIDIETGEVIGQGVYSDITKPAESQHPVTGVAIIGFQIPFWQEAKETVAKAALAFPANRSIGWDVAITANGVDLIEGNHDWCKLLWQLPEKKGMRPILEEYLSGKR